MPDHYLSPAGAGETWVLTHTRDDVMGPYTEVDTFTDPRTAIHILAGRVRKNWSKLAGKRDYPPTPPCNDFEAVALYFRNPREDLNGERFALDRCKTNTTQTPGAHVSGHGEYILVHPYQEWTCICGNTASASGFSPSDHRGVPMEDGPWHGFHVCPDCGRVIHNATGQVIGRATVEPTTAPTNTKQEVNVSERPRRTGREQSGHVDEVQAQTLALAEQANRNARWQPYGEGHDAPYVELCGLRSNMFADDEGRLVVDLDTLSVQPLADWPNTPEVIVDVEGRRVWSTNRPNDDAAWQVRNMVERALRRTNVHAGDGATVGQYLADLAYDLANALPADDPLRAAVERGSHPYTVTGMLDEHRNLTVTAVIAGAYPPVARDARRPGEYRFAAVVYALSPGAAERIACERAAMNTDD
ncbi:hypothetical protein [Micromonospora arborensis]|uniref:hypothetical protein n=1 Tax=Micromonospora arborensis TaxID=2116518 RepID=UPI00371D37BE